NLHNGCIQFLDLQVSCDGGFCWKYAQRSQKDLLPFSSNHSKTVKDGIVRSLLLSSLDKSCNHLTASSLEFQLRRLRRAGFPFSRIDDVFNRILVGGRSSRGAGDGNLNKIVVVPYRHGVSHRLKKEAGKVGVTIV